MIRLIYIDLFCGGGGTTTGVHNARIDGERCAIVAACINHDENAIRSHKSNHKQTLHFTEDITMLYNTSRMGKLIQHVEYLKGQYPDAEIILWASLECTNFSKAKGGLPRKADSRTLANHLFPYIEALKPDRIQIENVVEFMAWGPLDENGKPISLLTGEDYIKWIERVKSFGYTFDYRILNAADFGGLTSRRRYFGQFARHGSEIYWPEQTHAENPAHNLFGKPLTKWRAIKEVLDFADVGRSIFDRKKPLCDATLQRIYAGLIKFVAGGKKAFLVKWNSMSKNGAYQAPDIDSPCPVVTTQNRLGMCFISKAYSGKPEEKVQSINQPAGTITTKDHHQLINAEFISAYYGHGDNVHTVDKPCPTLGTKDTAALVQTVFIDQQYGKSKPVSIDKPSGTITGNPKLAPVTVSRMDDKFIMNQYSGGGQSSDIGKPCPAVSTVPKQNLITVKSWLMDTQFNNVGTRIDQPAPVITANRKHHYLMNPQYSSKGGSIDQPCFTLIARMDKQPPYLIETSADAEHVPSFLRITGDCIIYDGYDSDSETLIRIKEFMALYGILDIKMRMLRIPELKKIMGFPEDYVLVGTQTEQKKFIGNAVEVHTATAIVEATAKCRMEKNSAA